MHMHARLCQRRRADLGKAAGVVTAVIADGAALFTRNARKIRRKAARGLAHGVGVQIRDARRHDAADARRAEGLLVAEALFDLLGVVLDALEFFQDLAVCVLHPALKFFSCLFAHIRSPPHRFLATV